MYSAIETAKRLVNAFLIREGGILHYIEGDERSFELEFSVMDGEFRLSYEIRSSYNLYYTYGVDREVDVFKEINPFTGCVDDPDDFFEYRKSLPKFDVSEKFLSYLLENIPRFLELRKTST